MHRKQPPRISASLRLPVLDHTEIPSYAVAQRAHWIILGGFVALLSIGLLVTPFVRLGTSVNASGMIEPADLEIVRPLRSGILGADARRRVGLPIGPGDTLLKIPSRQRWEAVVLVSELDISRIHKGQHVTMEIPAVARLARGFWAGRVSAIDLRPLQPAIPVNASDKPTSFRVTVSLDADESAAAADILRPGYTVRAKVTTSSDRIWDLVVAAFRNRLTDDDSNGSR